MEKQLLDYVRSVASFSPERVKAALVQEGWSLEVIDAAFLQVQHEKSVARANITQGKQIAMMVASFIVIALLLFTAPSASVTGNTVYSPEVLITGKEVRVVEESISPAQVEAPTVLLQKQVSCAAILNAIEREKCFVSEAISKSDVRRCDTVNDVSRQTACVAVLALHTKDVRLCASAKSPDTCLLVFSKSDKKACNLIGNPPLRKTCLSR
ncbi:MAG TPA: hypothetical protein VJJ82_00850 [Candidatus Nanoarchaeia archaeon]|nr:hypothetical protein [Candidatus Nanoarchaeia archaeon]